MTSQNTSAPVTPRPLTPRPGLRDALGLLLALWIGAMLLMYFKTVYPQRYEEPAPTPSESAR